MIMMFEGYVHVYLNLERARARETWERVVYD